MIIKPSRRQEVIRPAVLVDAGRARSLDDGRVHDLAKLPPGLRAYVAWDDADRFARAGEGELVCWGDEPIRYRAVRFGDSHRRRSDAVVVKIPVDTHAQFDAGLSAFADWLAEWDVNPGWSLGGTSIALLRATLDSPLVTTLGDLPPPRWTLGGRQQLFVPHGTVVRGAVQLDLPAAYTHVIGNLRYGGAWRWIQPVKHVCRMNHDGGRPVLARANVALPEGLSVGPLHKRPKSRPDTRVEELAMTVPYPVDGRLQGLWTWAELEQALAAGAGVKVLEAWAHDGADRPFERWHHAIMGGRWLDGFGGQLAKATGNALWGQFVIDDRKRLRVQRWNGEAKTMTVQGSRGHQKRAWDVGELVCGTVRARLYSALAAAMPEDLVACHTDGLWLRDTPVTDFVRTNLEDDGWRVKTEAADLHVLDQQKYRYRLHRGRTFQVIFSGVPAHRSAETFQQLWERFA